MAIHTDQYDTSHSSLEAGQNDTDAERALIASIQRQLLIRFLKTDLLHHIQDASLIQFVIDNVGTDVLQDDAEYRAWVQSQGIDAENLHAITREGQELLHSLINQWVMDQATNRL